MYYYSPQKNEFFPKSLKQSYVDAGVFPDDVIEVADEIWLEFAGKQAPEGKMRIAGKNGLPCWVDTPPQTKEQVEAYAEQQKKYLIAETTTIIAPLQYAVDLDMATTEEVALLKAWKKYLVLLNRVDISTAPDIEWPQKPV